MILLSISMYVFVYKSNHFAIRTQHNTLLRMNAKMFAKGGRQALVMCTYHRLTLIAF